MEKYNVYGIGNALVDYEFEIDDNTLIEINVDKGLMTLVDENRQSELLEKLHQELPKRACGGSAANSMIAMAQLGGRSFYSCKVANDETGEFFYQDLKKNGVISSLSYKDREEGKTGKCMVFVTPDAERSMNTYLGITETLSKNDLVEEELKKSDFIYMEGYVVTSPTGRAAAIQAKKLADTFGVKSAITFSDPNMVQFFKEGLLEMVGSGVDLLFCNEAEAKMFSDTDDVYRAAEDIKKIAKTFAITLGAEGALVFDGVELNKVEGFKATAVDTNGAGDIFAGSFLFGITNGFSYFQSAKIANYAASLLVQKFGPRLNGDGIEKLNKFVDQL